MNVLHEIRLTFVQPVTDPPLASIEIIEADVIGQSVTPCTDIIFSNTHPHGGNDDFSSIVVKSLVFENVR